MKAITRWAGLCAFGVYASSAQPAEPGWDMLKAKPEVVEAWQDMRYGMFLCWGPVTLTGQEIGWSRGKGRPDQKQGGKGSTPADVYDSLYKKWKPDQFNARDWVRIARDGGMKYLIFLVKHHDGFCLYDTKLTDYRSTGPESAWKHDVMKDVADACHEAGLPLIVYYSQPDWHHPDYRTERHANYIKYFHGQIRELLTGYGKIDGFWFDLGGKPSDWDSEALFKMARSIQPGLIFNNRCGLPGDFQTPEQTLGAAEFVRPWESCVTLGTQWSWKPDDKIKSFEECLRLLVLCAGNGGNLALNTNPMPDGRIEPRQADRFREIGAWLAKHGESIYGTRGGPFVTERQRKGLGAGRLADPSALTPFVSTRKGSVIYLHVLHGPSEAIRLPGIPRKIVKGTVLTGGAVEVKQTEESVVLSVPKESRSEADTIIKLELDGSAADIRQIEVAGNDDAASQGGKAVGKK
jgi:alpha-L-fucosidase